MSFSLIAEFVSGIFRPAADLIDNLHTSDEEKLQAKATLMKIEQDTMSKAVELEGKIVDSKKDIIVAEAKGESWLQRNWRPILMLVCIFIVANNFIFAPYLTAMGFKGITLDLPDALWNLMTLGVGGYIGGRSVEKVVDKWKK